MKLAALAAVAVGFAGALAVTRPGAAQSQITTPATLPDTPAGRRFAEWLDVFNRGDDAALKAYVREALPDKGAPALLADVRSATGPLIPFKVTAPAPNALSV